MLTSDFDYHLPESLIAQEPVEPRDSARLMLVDRKSGSIEHETFSNLPKHLTKNDVLVFNDSKVVPFRLFGSRIRESEEAQAKIEILLLSEQSEGTWRCLAKPAKKLKKHDVLIFKKDEEALEFVVSERNDDDTFLIRTPLSREMLEKKLELIGSMPTPPYVKKEIGSKDQYQTIYAKHPGSAAAPTAGFHFTDRTFDDLEKMGIQIFYTTLHVGLGTFQPIKTDSLDKHTMHGERVILDEETAHAINEAKLAGKRIIAVGTTTLRLLESLADEDGTLRSTSPEGIETDIFIQPGYTFRCVDELLTNFHLPKSTLLVLVSAFAGTDLAKKAYQNAIEERYRFYSFGDAMLIR